MHDLLINIVGEPPVGVISSQKIAFCRDGESNPEIISRLGQVIQNATTWLDEPASNKAEKSRVIHKHADPQRTLTDTSGEIPEVQIPPAFLTILFPGESV